MCAMTHHQRWIVRKDATINVSLLACQTHTHTHTHTHPHTHTHTAREESKTDTQQYYRESYRCFRSVVWCNCTDDVLRRVRQENPPTNLSCGDSQACRQDCAPMQCNHCSVCVHWLIVRHVTIGVVAYCHSSCMQSRARSSTAGRQGRRTTW